MEGRVGVAELRKIQHQPVCIGGSHGWPGALHVLVYKKYAQQREEARGKEKVQPGDHRGVPNTGGMHVSQRLLECGMQVSVNKITFKRMANSDHFLACRRSRVSTSISCACGRFVSRCPRSWIPLPGDPPRRKGDRPPAASGLVQQEVETRLLGQIAKAQSEKGLRCFCRRAVVCKPGSHLYSSFMSRGEVLIGWQRSLESEAYRGSFDVHFVSRFKRRWRNFGFSSWEGDG